MSDPFESQCHGFEPSNKNIDRIFKTNKEEVEEIKRKKIRRVILGTEPLWRCEEQLVFPDHFMGYGWQ